MISETVWHFLSDNRSLLRTGSREDYKTLFKNTYTWPMDDVDHEDFDNQLMGELIEVFTNDLKIKTNDIRMEVMEELIIELLPEIDFQPQLWKDWFRKWVGLNTLGLPLAIIASDLSHNKDFLELANLIEKDGRWHIYKRR